MYGVMFSPTTPEGFTCVALVTRSVTSALALRSRMCIITHVTTGFSPTALLLGAFSSRTLVTRDVENSGARLRGCSDFKRNSGPSDQASSTVDSVASLTLA